MVVRVDDKGRALTEGPQVEIGGNERYVSVSRAEFKKITSGRGHIELQQPDKRLRVRVDVNAQIRVRPSDRLVSDVEKICGAGSVVIGRAAVPVRR
jgi:hypothetical protein